MYGNPSSMHVFGGEVGRKVAEARETVARLLGADPSEIIFTSCGTESDNAALRGVMEAQAERRRIVTTRVEHPAVLNVCKYLEGKGYPVTYLPVDGEGRLDMADVRKAITDDTALVSVMYGNNETGVLFPVEEIAQAARDKGAVFHTDAVQAAGKLPLDMGASAIDMLSISGHKLHAPKGVGVLYVRRGTRFSPLLIGGHQERGRRGGTENVPYIVGMARACELAAAAREEEATRVRALRDRLEKELLARVPDARVNGGAAERLPNTTNIGFDYVEGEAILLMFSDVGIAASSGSACTSGSLEPSHVLRAMGIPFTSAHGSIRFSLSRYNTDADVDAIVEHTVPVIERLRAISPFGREDVRVAP
jgi:cysteine desulfurase